ncbi:cupin domain-containing protein, partial [Acinetobacter baumannii]|uniref:cupin domain-containing protein n=1 Tax=Acinetobacter baumannii TaxID=470 RepID=UPI0011145248
MTTSQPSQVIQSEAGTTEFWNQNEDQFLCAGVSAHRRTLQPNSLLVPTYNPAPILIYIQQGRGLLGVNIPGCAQTFTSQGEQQQQQPGQQQPGSQEE